MPKPKRMSGKGRKLAPQAKSMRGKASSKVNKTGNVGPDEFSEVKRGHAHANRKRTDTEHRPRERRMRTEAKTGIRYGGVDD